ncbi:MAG: hypothetical protein EOP11_05180 [Proteobacteria bacterium]|nr:MAG: hypothetical protein EOP11_05180 [Pseudomonadota bacterium]
MGFIRALVMPLLTLGLVIFSPLAIAGDEDVRAEKPKVEAPTPADQALPEAPEVTEGSLGEEETPAAPSFGDPSAPVKAAKKNPRWPYDADRNIDYSELMGIVETADPGRGVLPPAPGFRGYRPNMVAVGAGERVPGYGVMVEYSWNRLGFGGYYSYRNLTEDAFSSAQSFLGLYGIYRWLPWDFSPYILLGLEGAKATPESFGGIVGFGADARLFYGATLFLGYTYHSTAQKGFFGGGIGWSF